MNPLRALAPTEISVLLRRRHARLGWLLSMLMFCAWTQARASADHDGSHDFDFNLGTWHTQIVRTTDPFSAPGETALLHGTVTVRKVWGGKAQLEEIEADGPDGHWEGMTLFLYNPKAQQWSQTYAGSASGELEPPLLGAFHDGRGELFAQDTLRGRSILVKGVWSQITPDGHHFDEFYSQDGGQSWKQAFAAVLTRMAPAAHDDATAARPFQPPSENDPQHAFDWDVGRWTIHLSRLQQPLSGSQSWSETEGVTVNSRIWGGRANLAEVHADMPSGPFDLLALRLYKPATHEWTTSFATSGVGMLNTPTGQPTVGTVHEGHLEFYDQEPYNGRSILVRFRIGPVSAGAAESEQAFSSDGGRTWETNWVNRYSRIRD